MPDYKRKKFKKFGERKGNHSKTKEHYIKKEKPNDKIGVVPEGEIKVVRGNKFKRQRKIKILSAIIAVLCIFFLILSITLPVSLNENITNLFATMGPGSFPVSVSGSTVLNTVSNGSSFYVLTDTNISAYSNGGKIIFDELHGFSNPIISTSSTRVLIYDQGGKVAYIYNLGGKIHEIKTENEIITASISLDGDFAIATRSDRYTSVATAYNKNAEKMFSFNSAKEIITNALVDTDGENLAVTTLNANGGKFDTKLMIFNYKSADPKHTLNLNGEIPLALTNTGKGISLICSDTYKFIDWNDFATNVINVSGEINIFRNSKNGLLLAFNRANDRSDNTIVLISKKGEKISEFKINETITDIQYNDNRVYFVGDTNTVIYDNNGKLLRHGECNYGVKNIAVVSDNSIAAVTDNEIIKTNIEK